MLRIDAAGLRSRVSPLTGTRLGSETRERPYRRPERVAKGHDLRDLARRVTTLREALDPFTRTLSLLAATSRATTEAREARRSADAEAAAAEAEEARRDEPPGNDDDPRAADAERALAAERDGPSPALREHVVQSLHELALALEGLGSRPGEHDEAAAGIERRLAEDAERVLARALGEPVVADEPPSLAERAARHEPDDDASLAAEARALVAPGRERDAGARRRGPRLALDDARVDRALRTNPGAMARVLGGVDGRSGVVGGLRRAAEGAVQRLVSQLGPNEGTGILLDVSA